MSRCPIHPDDLFPNLALREDIELWLAAHPDAPEAAPPLPPGGYPMKEACLPQELGGIGGEMQTKKQRLG